MERLRDTHALAVQQPPALAAAHQGHQQQQPVMEMLRLQTQISDLVDQLRNITIQASGMSPAVGSPMPGAGAGEFGVDSSPAPHAALKAAACDDAQQQQQQPLPPLPAACNELHLSKAEHARGVNVSRDLIKHLVSVYFQYSHPSETGMYPLDLYRDRLQRAQVSETFLLSVLAVASRLSDDPRVKREPAYLAGYDFFERVTRGLMMDVLERDCVENMLTLNNLAVYAVGLPVANRGWYFSGLAMRMATQMSLQKVDAPGRMPAASMLSGPGIESARRAFWTTLLLEALASFASGEPPPITIQDVHVAEPADDPPMLDDDAPPVAAAPGGPDHGLLAGGASERRAPNVSAFTAQLSMLLIRVARLNGNRHPESAQFSPEYAALHAEMVAWYHALPDNMQIRGSAAARDEILGAPQLFAAKMFVHCHYHAAIIALHQPRADLVRVESSDFRRARGTSSSNNAGDNKKSASSAATSPGDLQWRQLAQQQCLTAACTMTELLMLARTLDVRYHIVTFGFAVFMAGVVHVGAVACTPRDSNERQYSVNCVKEHVRCLDRLGKYFAFHFIMAKHIRAQLHAIEAADARRQNAHAQAVAEAISSRSCQQQHAPPMPFDLSAALAMAPQPQPPPHLPPHLLPFASAGAGGVASSVLGALGSAAADGSSWLGMSPGGSASQEAPASLGFGTAPSSTSAASSLDMFLGLFSAVTATPTPMSPAAAAASTPYVQQPQQQCPIPGSCGGLCGTHSPTTAASMAFQLHQSFSSMAGLGSDLSSLVELFSSNSDGSASLYPENILSSSLLAPANSAAQAAELGSAEQLTAPMVQHAVPVRSTAAPAMSHASSNPASLLRFTSPGAGGLQQFGSLPPFSPL
ncbi:hypothetical protein GGF42_006105 [Coemansia sp. RSA 2424]|nr:hypothetical protein GGF42_006105 [Coemansia sp. RSA 2424]